jgi:biopolymer transport protein ExbB
MFNSFLSFFIEGGPFMIPLILCSIFSVTIMLERGYALRRVLIVKPTLSRAIMDLRYGEDTTLIEQLSSGEETTLSRLAASCLQHMPWPKAENIESLQTRARAEVSAMERGFVVLEICVGIGPLLGLLGTVYGLIVIFAQAKDEGLVTQGMFIASGISQALHCTVAGLVVAIPSLIAFSFFSRRVENFAVELESLCSDLLVKLYATAEAIAPTT